MTKTNSKLTRQLLESIITNKPTKDINELFSQLSTRITKQLTNESYNSVNGPHNDWGLDYDDLTDVNDFDDDFDDEFEDDLFSDNDFSKKNPFDDNKSEVMLSKGVDSQEDADAVIEYLQSQGYNPTTQMNKTTGALAVKWSGPQESLDDLNDIFDSL